MPNNSIADDLADTFTFKKQRQAATDAVNKVKDFLGVSHPTETAPSTSDQDKATDAAYRAQMLKNVHDSAVKQQATTPTPSTKPTPKYKNGTDYVPKTGPAILHKGEAVLNKEDANKHRESKMKGYDVGEELGGKKEEKPKKEIKHITTKKAKNGGYIHEHHHTAPEHHPMEEHVSPDQDAMVSHMMDHMGEANPGEAEADAGQAGLPAAGQPAQAQPAPQPAMAA